MSDEPFQRPGSRPGGADLHPSPRPSVWDEGPEDPVPVLVGETAEPAEVPTRGRTTVALAAALGILVGVAGTVFALNAGNGSMGPVEITPETFPREVLSLLRDDLRARDLNDTEAIERLDSNFAQQLENHRFAYGGDGATMYYSVGGSGVEYTIVNGVIPPAIPSHGVLGAGELPVMVSFESDDVVCTVEQAELTLDAATGAADPSGPGLSSCVLTDATRNLSLRLIEVGVPRTDSAQSAERMAAELLHLYEDLTS